MNIQNCCTRFVLFVTLLTCCQALAANQSLPRSTPEAQGVPSAAIQQFIETADREINTLHSFMLVKNGHVVAEAWWKPESPEKRHVMWSLSKSFCSTAAGFAVAEGKISLDDPVLKYFKDEAPAEPNEHLKAMKVRDLLTMSGGHATEPKFDFAVGPTVTGFLEHPVEHPPGTHFRYNTPGTFMVSAIITKATGQTVLDYLKPRLFEPLGIDDPQWDLSPEGYSLGGYGLHIRTEDIAKFGLLYLQKGKWNGKQLLPEDWVNEATSNLVDNSKAPSGRNPDWQQGYGFQFWRCRHNAYRGDGKDGQICLVIPEHQVVIAITAHTGQMQAELDLVWNILLPSFKNSALPENPEAVEKLKQTSASLTAHPNSR